MSYEIVTDSSANLTDELIDKYGVHIISLFFTVDGEEYQSYEKGVETNIKQFYGMMREGKVINTSHINLEVCKNAFEEILSEGKDVLYIGFSSALSGTYGTGAVAAKELAEKYPDRKIYAVDSLAASMGEGLLVYYAANMKLEGKGIDEVRDWLEDNKLNLCHWFTVDDLNFLKRGGRVSAAAAFFGTALSIKPVMHVDDEGRLIPVSKVRGRKNSLHSLVREMENTCVEPEGQMVFISHGDCLDDAQYVERMVREKFPVKDVLVNYVDPVIGAHSGPGTVALFFLGNKR